MSRHARTTSLHRPTTSGYSLHRHARHVSRGSSSSTHRTHEVHARRQDGRGRVFARDATRPASLDGPVERSPSRSRRHPRSARLRAAVPETAQVLVLVCNLGCSHVTHLNSRWRMRCIEMVAKNKQRQPRPRHSPAPRPLPRSSCRRRRARMAPPTRSRRLWRRSVEELSARSPAELEGARRASPRKDRHPR